MELKFCPRCGSNRLKEKPLISVIAVQCESCGFQFDYAIAHIQGVQEKVSGESVCIKISKEDLYAINHELDIGKLHFEYFDIKIGHNKEFFDPLSRLSCAIREKAKEKSSSTPRETVKVCGKWRGSIFYVDIDGKTVLTMHFGDELNQMDTKRVHININPKFWMSDYEVVEVHSKPESLYVLLMKYLKAKPCM